jgi:transcription initiation factor IIE alpha subunit
MRLVSIATNLEEIKAVLVKLYNDNAITFENCDSSLSNCSKFTELSNQLKQINSIADLFSIYQAMFDYVFLDLVNSF